MAIKRCITFAGAVGSSKTPIANYLSTSLNLPVLNNDAIRVEVTEDLLIFDTKTYDKRQEDRCEAMLATGNSFIYDASVDRKWSSLDRRLKEHGYRCFIISLDLSYDLLVRLYRAKGYGNIDQLPSYIKQHRNFVSNHNDRINVTITDADFSDRLTVAFEQVNSWMVDRSDI